VCFYIPAIVASEVAVVGGVAQVGIADAEAHFGCLSAWVLVTCSCLQRADGVVTKARLVVDEAFAVRARSGELYEDDWIVVSFDRIGVVCSLWVNQDAELLVKVDIAW